MDSIIKEELEIKQEHEDIETKFQILEVVHIFKQEPINDEYFDDPIEGELNEDCVTAPNYSDIKLEPTEQEQDSIGLQQNNNIKFETVHHDHCYARAYQPFIDRNRQHNRKASEIKKKSKHRPVEQWKPQTCSICGARFVLRTSFEKHLIRHGATRSLFECDVCGVKCKLIKHLHAHFSRSHGLTLNGRVQCNVCGKYYHRHYLSAHRSIHTTQHLKPSFECTICGKFFHIRANLTSHQRVHRKQKEPCKVCGKWLTVPGALRVHERIHTGEKPFLCWICGSRFRSKSTFDTHLTVHWTGKNFPCKLCDAKFKNPNCLDGHRRKVHLAKTRKVIPIPVNSKSDSSDSPDYGSDFKTGRIDIVKPLKQYNGPRMSKT